MMTYKTVIVEVSRPIVPNSNISARQCFPMIVNAKVNEYFIQDMIVELEKEYGEGNVTIRDPGTK